MTEAQRFHAVSKAIKDYTKEHTKTPEAARAALVSAGILTARGNLRKRFDESRVD